MKELTEDLDRLCGLLKKFKERTNLLQNLSEEQIDEINGSDGTAANAIDEAFEEREKIMSEITAVNARFNANSAKKPPGIAELIRRAFSGELLHFPTKAAERELCEKIGDACSLRSEILRADKAIAHKFKRRFSELHELLAEGTDAKKKIQFYSAYAASVTPYGKIGKGGNMDNNA